MDRNDHDNLNTYGTIYQVLSIIAALILAGLAINHFVNSANAPEILARAHQAAGWTYLAYAVAAVLGGQFLKAVTTWMTSMYANLAELKAKVAHLESRAAQSAKAPTSHARVPAPLNESRHMKHGGSRAPADDPKPSKAIRSDSTLTCTSCGHSFTVTPGTTWHSCPNCRTPFEA